MKILATITTLLGTTFFMQCMYEAELPSRQLKTSINEILTSTIQVPDFYVPSEPDNIVQKTYEEMAHHKHVQAFITLARGLARYPHSFLIQMHMADLLVYYAQITRLSPELKNRMVLHAEKILENLLKHINTQPEELLFIFIYKWNDIYNYHDIQYVNGLCEILHYEMRYSNARQQQIFSNVLNINTDYLSKFLAAYHRAAMGATNHFKQLLEHADHTVTFYELQNWAYWAYSALALWKGYFFLLDKNPHFVSDSIHNTLQLNYASIKANVRFLRRKLKDIEEAKTIS